MEILLLSRVFDGPNRPKHSRRVEFYIYLCRSRLKLDFHLSCDSHKNRQKPSKILDNQILLEKVQLVAEYKEFFWCNERYLNFLTDFIITLNTVARFGVNDDELE